MGIGRSELIDSGYISSLTTSVCEKLAPNCAIGTGLIVQTVDLSYENQAESIVVIIKSVPVA